MSETDLKLCKICLSSNAEPRSLSNTCLIKFFVHVLGIHEPTSKIRLCNWCTAVLRKTGKLVKLAAETQSILLNVKMKNTTEHNCSDYNRTNLYNLSVHHNSHDNIEPANTRNPKRTKSQKNKTNKIQFIDMNEANNVINELKTEDKIEVEISLDKVKLETVEMDETLDINDRLEDRNDHTKILQFDKNAINNEINESKVDDDKVEVEILLEDVKLETTDDGLKDSDDGVSKEQSRRKVSRKFHDKCKQNNFILKILTLEEQMAELEEKKKSDKYLSRKYKCEHCGIGFVTKDVFDEHSKKHQESHSPHECRVCHLRFSTSLVLSQHSLAHQRRFRCQLCGAVVRRYSDCEVHRRKCGQATPGVCPHCKKIFSNQSSLEQHIRGVHYKKEKKFVCTFCNQRFQSKQRLDIHTRTHTGAKPYTCEVCRRSFAAGSNLRYHLAAHAQARPHYCVECDRSYKTQKSLRRHLVEGAAHRASSLHSCEHCLKHFTSAKLLASHVGSVHTNPDACGLCDKTFSTSADLNKHIRSAHKSTIK